MGCKSISPRLTQFKCFRRHGRPRYHEAVVVAGLLCPALALAERVEPVGEVAGNLGHSADLRLQIRRFLLALRTVPLDVNYRNEAIWQDSLNSGAAREIFELGHRRAAASASI